MVSVHCISRSEESEDLKTDIEKKSLKVLVQGPQLYIWNLTLIVYKDHLNHGLMVKIGLTKGLTWLVGCYQDCSKYCYRNVGASNSGARLCLK